ncbi:MAG: alpha-amylase family glycosyl hydrolase [Paludibacteraceae bacterium]|nr:alpha-amylase family glycosyl hydrolase [Paludibacteraceae bacterium]
MRNKVLLIISLFVMSMVTNAKPVIQRVEPLCWWTEMNTPLTLLFQGEDLADAQVTVQEVVGNKVMRGQCLGLVPKAQHNAESPNYLFVDMDVKQAGTYRITLTKNKKKAAWTYTINPRREGSRMRQSFTSADVVYLIMSDRFVDGDESNNNLPQMAEKTDKSNIHGRFGGDIAGIISQLDHISRLGATAIWPTPLLEDNEAAWSYHGYACSDYYHIDPRYGSNELYCSMVEIAHEKGIKVLMDMVPNHCGSTHWWMKDLPYHDWINQFDEFTTTSNVFSANYDTNASEYDRNLSNRGWFDKPMPDMNLENPDLLKYFQQWAIWWIEYANLDGLRVDTYPYIEPVPGSKWLKAIREEYPNINIVGECWTRPASAVAYWQSGVKNYNGFDSNLPTVMDFPVEESIRQALENDGKEWGAGLTRVYDAVAQDYLYADVNKLFMFLGNHDMDRFADIVKDNDPRRVKLGYVLLATMRGIPQVFAGDEYAMRSADRSIGHSALRMPLPLGKDVTPQQQEMFDFQSRLFQWRKGEPVIHTGRTMHFMGRDNTYAFFRYNTDEAVFVFVNASEEERVIPMDHYAEITGKYQPQGKEILTDTTVDMTKPRTIAPLSAMIVKLLHK